MTTKASAPAPKSPTKSLANRTKTPARASAKTRVAMPLTQPTAAPKTVRHQPITSTTPAVKDKKIKVVRDSFTLPKAELLRIGDMKKRALTLGVAVKKSELIRAGLSTLSNMPDAAFKRALASVPTIKTGRPSKD